MISKELTLVLPTKNHENIVLDNLKYIDSLNKETIDFNLGLRQELYQNKLIIVSNFNKIIKFIDLLIGMNLIDSFLIDIRKIESLPDGMDLYQVIVE